MNNKLLLFLQQFATIPFGRFKDFSYIIAASKTNKRHNLCDTQKSNN